MTCWPELESPLKSRPAGQKKSGTSAALSWLLLRSSGKLRLGFFVPLWASPRAQTTHRPRIRQQVEGGEEEVDHLQVLLELDGEDLRHGEADHLTSLWVHLHSLFHRATAGRKVYAPHSNSLPSAPSYQHGRQGRK